MVKNREIEQKQSFEKSGWNSSNEWIIEQVHKIDIEPMLTSMRIEEKT